MRADLRTFRRGRTLLVVAILMAFGAGVAWLAQYYEQGPAWAVGLHRPLLGASALAFVSWIGFQVLGAILARAGRPRGARSLVHLQSVAAIVVVLVATGAAVGGLQTALLSLGLVGFGLTLALQRPILALAGWATLVFGGAVREGDRIQVGDVTGDVLDINLFNTRIWEVGSPGSATPGRPTGRIRTLSNAAFLEDAVANSTNDTATVFDEFVVNVAFESDQALAQRLLVEVGSGVLNPGVHKAMAEAYRRLARGLTIEAEFPDAPFVLAESKPSWMEYRLRYLVDARRAGRIQSALAKAWQEASADHAQRLLPIYPRMQQMAIQGDGSPRP